MNAKNLKKISLGAVALVVTAISTSSFAGPATGSVRFYYSDATYTQEVGEFTYFCSGAVWGEGYTTPYYIIADEWDC